MEVFFEERCSWKFHQLNEKRPVLEALFQYSCRTEACNFIKSELAKLLKTPFLKSTSGRLLLRETFCKYS